MAAYALLPPEALQVARLTAQSLSELLSRRSQAYQTASKTNAQAALQTPPMRRPSRFGPLPQPGLLAHLQSDTPAAQKQPATSLVRGADLSINSSLHAPAAVTTGVVAAARNQDTCKQFCQELCLELDLERCQEVWQEPSCPVSNKPCPEPPASHCLLPGTTPGTTSGKAFSPFNGKYIQPHRQNNASSPRDKHRCSERATPRRTRTHSRSRSRSIRPSSLKASMQKETHRHSRRSPPARSTVLPSPAAHKHTPQHERSSTRKASICPAIRLSVGKPHHRQFPTTSAALSNASSTLGGSKRTHRGSYAHVMSRGRSTSHGHNLSHGCYQSRFQIGRRANQRYSLQPSSSRRVPASSAIGSKCSRHSKHSRHSGHSSHRHKQSRHSMQSRHRRRSRSQPSRELHHSPAKRLKRKHSRDQDASTTLDQSPDLDQSPALKQSPVMAHERGRADPSILLRANARTAGEC